MEDFPPFFAIFDEKITIWCFKFKADEINIGDGVLELMGIASRFINRGI